MHHAWAIFASTEDYLSRFPHITQLWQVILTLPASTTSCERGFWTQNLIKSFGRCALNITTLDALMRIAMAKIPMESLDFEDIWERWMSVKDRRFQEWFRLWISYIFLLLLSCCPRDNHWYQYVEMSLPFQYTQTSMFHYWNSSIFSPCVFFGLTYIIVCNIA